MYELKKDLFDDAMIKEALIDQRFLNYTGR